MLGFSLPDTHHFSSFFHFNALLLLRRTVSFLAFSLHFHFRLYYDYLYLPTAGMHTQVLFGLRECFVLITFTKYQLP